MGTALTAVQESFNRFLERDLNKELLRFTTAGSVDDGKSTLIGRLLHDSKAVYEDQLASVKNSRINRSGGSIDFSLITDGLRAEREQGITIDVAYRYFSTARRKFIIADTPGHEQYTRNMATGASTADLAIILIDSTKGLLAQTRRHAYIASLLGIPTLLAAVNKMDLVGYREDVFLRLQEDFRELARQLHVPAVECIPISALTGDNVVTRSGQMGWYAGPALLEYLEHVDVPARTKAEELRFPIQSVIRPDASFRGFAGQLAGGTLRPGDSVLALPSGQQARVQAIVSYHGELEEAFAPMSITLQLDREIDLSRGDMLVSPDAPPQITRRFAAMVVWFNAKPLELEHTFLLKHAGRYVKARATRIQHRVDVETLAEHAVNRLQMNEIACIEFETHAPLYVDSYAQNRTTGAAILIDSLSNATLGAAMVQESLFAPADTVWEELVPQESRKATVTTEDRARRHGHVAGVIVIENRAELAARLEAVLFAQGFEAVTLREGRFPQGEHSSILDALLSAGLVVIYSTSSIAKGRSALKRIPQASLLSFPDGSLPESDAGAIRQILTSVNTHRVSERFPDSSEGQGT